MSAPPSVGYTDAELAALIDEDPPQGAFLVSLLKSMLAGDLRTERIRHDVCSPVTGP